MNIKQTNLYVFFGGLLGIPTSQVIKDTANSIPTGVAGYENAMSKGIDPLSVRCTYAPDTDNICLAYALRGREHNTDIPAPIRK